MTTYFCDGLKEVTVANGVVRLEFHRLEAVQRWQNRELQPIAEFTIALPMQGFMQALGVLTQLFLIRVPRQATRRENDDRDAKSDGANGKGFRPPWGRAS